MKLIACHLIPLSCIKATDEVTTRVPIVQNPPFFARKSHPMPLLGGAECTDRRGNDDDIGISGSDSDSLLQLKHCTPSPPDGYDTHNAYLD